jgi:transcriptional regulator with XRE-family HTH domain
MAQVGELVKKRREELRLTQQQVAERYNQHLSRELERPITRFRIAKIEAASQAQPGSGSAKALQPAEVHALAKALDLPAELFAGSDDGLGVIWDPLGNRERVRDVLSMFREYGRRSKRVTGWARFLPCSLETPEFLRAHNASIFKGIPDPEYRQTVIETFNEIGMERRRLLSDSGARRDWDFYHLMFRADLERIALGRGEYRGFSAYLREGCLENLRNLIADPGLQISMVVAEVSDLRGMERFLTGLDSTVVFDQHLAWWRDYRGYLYWSTNKQVVQMHAGLVSTFIESASFGDNKAVLRLLGQLLRKVRKGKG